MHLTSCPECGSPAEITEQFSLGSTSGPVEHVRIACVRRHWFLLPIPQPRSPSDDAASTGEGASPASDPSRAARVRGPGR
jgi:hypothetical protein